MRKPQVFATLRELAKSEALKSPQDFDTDILQEIEIDFQRTMQEYYDDPYSAIAPSECSDIPARRFQRALNELDQRYFDGEVK